MSAILQWAKSRTINIAHPYTYLQLSEVWKPNRESSVSFYRVIISILSQSILISCSGFKFLILFDFANNEFNHKSHFWCEKLVAF